MPDAKVRIFVSSPSDVDHERALVKEICARLRQEYRPYFEVQSVLWEEEALTADSSFQDGIIRPADCDIVVVLLWTRLGTPLPDKPYGGMTGTQWEFVNAVDASARDGRPKVLVYKKTKPKLVDITNAEATREALEDRRRLEDFFRVNFFNEDASFRRAFRTFDSDPAFRDLVEGQLRKLLNRRISAEKRAISAAGDWRGNPFRADRPYDLSDARIFTGREAEARDLLTRLTKRGLLLVSGPSGCGKTSLIRAGVLPRLARPFLVEGVAGSRIALVDPGAGGGAADPLAALAEGLCSRGALDQTLEGFGLDQPALARLLSREPLAAAAQVVAALDQLGREQRGRTGVAEGELRLALVLDPLDALLAADPDHRNVPGETRAALAEAVGALAATGRVWVVGVVGTARLCHLDPFLPLLAGTAVDRGAGDPVPLGLDPDAWYPLEPLAQARVRQVVEIPARVAGIDLEGSAPGSDLGLVELLETEVATLPHWPPLVEATLERVHQFGLARAQGGILALSGGDYRAAGGLPGVVLARAEALWAGLDAPARSALPRLCRALITLDGVRPRLRAGDLTLLESDPGCRALVAAMVDARLVVLDAERDPLIRTPCPAVDYSLASYVRDALQATGARWRARLNPSRGLRDLAEGGLAEAPPTGSEEAEPGVAPVETGPEGGQGAEDQVGPVAGPEWGHAGDWRPQAVLVHPALLTGWAPIRNWLADQANREGLVVRAHVSRRAHLWRRTDCNREHLLGEAGFATARRLKRDLAGELEPLEVEYLTQSEHHLGFQRRRNRALRALGATLVVLLAVATAAALWALDASQRARVALHRSLLDGAATDIARGNSPRALMRTLAAAPYLPQEATDMLSRVLVGNRLIAMVQGGPQTIPGPGRPAVSPVFSDDGERLVTADRDAGVSLWRLSGGRYELEASLAGPGLDIRVLALIGQVDAAQVLAGGPGGVWRLPVKPVPEPSPAPGTAPDFPCPVVSSQALAQGPNGRFVAIAHPFATEPAAEPHGAATFGPETTSVSHGGAGQNGGAHGVCVLDLGRPGAVQMDLPLHAGKILSLGFSPDGQRLITASADGSAKVIDLISGTEVLSLPPEGKLRRPVQRAVFDPSGSGRIALACSDQQVRVFGGDGTLMASLKEIRNGPKTVRVHTSAVQDLGFSPDGRYLVAGDDDGQVVRWDPDQPDQALVLGQHELPVAQVRLAPPHGDPDAEPLVLTASQDRTARLWGLYTGRPIAAFSHDAAVTDARFSTDGSRVLTSSDIDGSARAWSIHRIPGIGFRMALPDHMGPVAFSPAPAALDPRRGGAVIYAVAGHDGQVGVWRYDRNAPEAAPGRLWLLGGHQGRVRDLAFAPSGRWLASAAADGTARIWDLRSGAGCVLDAGGEGGAKEVQRVLFAPDEDWLLTASDDRRQPVRLWSWDGKSCPPLEPGPAFAEGQAKVQAAALGLTPDGALLAATGDDAGRLRVMRRKVHADPATQWERLCELEAHRGPILDLDLSPDGAQLASAGEDGNVRLTPIGPSGCGPRPPLTGHTAIVYKVRFAPDGETLVTASLDETARVWRADGAPLATLAGHRARVGQADFSPDGRWLLTGSRDGDLRLWRAPTAPSGILDQPFLTIDAGLRGVTGAAFSPEGNQILAGYWGNAAQLWRIWSEDTPSADLVRTWGRERARLALTQEAERYRRDNRLDLRRND